MFDLFAEIGASVVSNIAQLIIGCLLSIPLYYLAAEKMKNIKSGFISDTALIVAFSLLGALLPLGPYGVIPIFAALLAAGLKPFIALPLLIANTCFNMLIPYNDVSFTWRTGIERVIFALFAAILAGMAFRIFVGRGKGLLRLDNITALGEINGNLKGSFGIIARNISLAGPYLIVGVIVDTVFHKYIWWDFLNFITHNSYTDFIPGFFSRFNVTNPLFLLALTIALILLDLVRTFAYALIFRLKGLSVYYIYFAAWALLLGMSAFI